MRNQTLLERLSNGETLSGLSIFIKSTHPENEIRSRASLLSYWVCTEIEIDGVADDVLIDALSILRREYTDPKHYGDNKPGHFFLDHTLISPDPAFNYWDFWSFALSVPTGFVGLSHDIGLDQRVTYRIFCGLIALLLIDDSIRCLGIGDVFRAAAGIFDALEAFDEMLVPRRYEQIAQETRSAQAKRGGHAKNRETDEYKRLVIEEWKSGRFGCNKTEAARWAVKNFPLKSQEAVRRWLRKYEADSGDTTKPAE
jgi:hypothetical protein